MAFILNHNTQSLCYLYGHHSFGRLAYSVNTLVSNAAVSKIHAIIEWENDAWHIRDLSSNGTWLNNRRLPENTKAQLKLNDDIYFAGLKDIRFTVKDLSAPCDLLIPLNLETNPGLLKANSGQLPAFSLSHYHLLPSEQNPEIVLYLNRFNGLWSVEYLNQENITLTDAENLSRGQSIHNTQHPHVVNEHDIITFAGQKWRLQLSHLEKSTELLSNNEEKINQLSFTFNLTPDEEETQLKLHHQGKTTDFQVRSHHYLTLNLARYRVIDIQKGLAPELQGWVYPEQLAKDIGLSISHLNIQIHRARKQFVDALINISDAEDIIQRQSGKIRFGGSVFRIYKGQHLEAASGHDMAEQTVKKNLTDAGSPPLRDENNNNMVANFVEN
ncbi:FHA domain-containing protein [Thalassomonas viridans]|uniref:FHA domain-containing protein n=1 Tax=Thalassomonas viridans TaxID=137584 RepID=A0AAE9YZY4_9GAMM|nr:FHA domain-containing protein [Thalassomonas viridans]WDE03504.1 FHA domain-containing protein [Thalassomonas viridans]